jgi:DNA-binding Lrp family transcriptional regulator
MAKQATMQVGYTPMDLIRRPKTTDTDWIIEDMIPRVGRTLVFGKGGCGKSTLIFDLCIAVAGGKKTWNDFPILHNGPVIIVSTEGSLNNNEKRLFKHMRGLDVDPQTLPLLFFHDAFRLDSAEDITGFATYIEAMRPAILVLDPLDSFMTADENSPHETKCARHNLDGLINEYNLSIIVIHHEAKRQDNNPAPRGTTALPAWADSVLHVTNKKKAVTFIDPSTNIKIEEKVTVVNMGATKQRDGDGRHLLSVVVHHNNTLQTVHCSHYIEASPEQVLIDIWKSKLLGAIKSSKTPPTNRELAAILGLSAPKIAMFLRLLENDGIIRKDAPTLRPSRTGVTQLRMGWRSFWLSKVDRAMILYAKMAEEPIGYAVCEGIDFEDASDALRHEIWTNTLSPDEIEYEATTDQPLGFMLTDADLQDMAELRAEGVDPRQYISNLLHDFYN